jgi:hypothetical protein
MVLSALAAYLRRMSPPQKKIRPKKRTAAKLRSWRATLLRQRAQQLLWWIVSLNGSYTLLWWGRAASGVRPCIWLPTRPRSALTGATGCKPLVGRFCPRCGFTQA